MKQFDDTGPLWFFPGSVPFVGWALLIVFQFAREQKRGIEDLRRAEAAMRAEKPGTASW